MNKNNKISDRIKRKTGILEQAEYLHVCKDKYDVMQKRDIN